MAAAAAAAAADVESLDFFVEVVSISARIC